MKVLVGVDGSEGGFEAARQACRLLDPKRDQLALYFAMHDVRLEAAPNVDSALVGRARGALAGGIFDEALSRLDPAWKTRVETIVGERRPAQGLVIAADEWRAEMIAVGARGLGRIAALLVGSVALGVLHHTRVPVLVARARPDGAEQPLKVLVACDGSESSRAAVDFLPRLTWPSETRGRLVQVIESMFVGELPQWLVEKARDADTEAMAKAWVEGHERERNETLERLRQVCGQLPPPLADWESAILEGNAAEQILAAAGSMPADLVVLGARGLGRWSRMVLGSTSEKVLTHAGCSVLIVRKHEAP